jgi:hypothetical protein
MTIPEERAIDVDVLTNDPMILVKFALSKGARETVAGLQVKYN